jgi:uncharacterized protein (DUF2336 family)
LGRINKLSREALPVLLEETNWTARAKCAERLTALYCQRRLDATERTLAEETFRLLCYDGEILVRRLLAECLKREPNLPRDIALALANDKSDVAVPFIEDSPTLDDRDLLAILRDHPGPHRLAIARRPTITAALSDALCRCGDPAIILGLLANHGAVLSTATLRWLLDRRAGHAVLQAAVLRAIACRRSPPIATDGRLTDMRHAS